MEEKRQEDKRIWLEAEKVARELKERKEAMERKRMADLKEKEDEANKLALQAASALLASDRDSEEDPADLKMAAMDELKRRWKVTKGKKREHTAESQKQKLHSASTVESEGEDGNASVGPSTHMNVERSGSFGKGC